MIRRLEDLDVLVVGARVYRWSHIEADNAADEEASRPEILDKPARSWRVLSTPFRAASESAYHFFAAGVYAGIRPSVGSMMSDVCLVTRGLSVQNRL